MLYLQKQLLRRTGYPHYVVVYIAVFQVCGWAEVPLSDVSAYTKPGPSQIRWAVSSSTSNLSCMPTSNSWLLGPFLFTFPGSWVAPNTKNLCPSSPGFASAPLPPSHIRQSASSPSQYVHNCYHVYTEHRCVYWIKNNHTLLIYWL